MLKKKVIGIFLSTQESITIKDICSLTNEDKDVILSIVNTLIKENKIEWTKMMT